MPRITRQFLPEDYPDEAGARAVVHVNGTTAPRAYLEETAWLNALADERGLDMRLVVTVDPQSRPDRLRADLARQTSCGRVAGARVYAGAAPFSTQARVLCAWLAERDLVLDLVTGPAQMERWADFLEEFPALRVALEHSGLPDGADPVSRQRWMRAMSSVAARTGWTCKLSGISMAVGSMTADDLLPWLRDCVTIWGWDRVM